MQQRQSTASQFATQTLAYAATSVKTAPIALDAATLKLVAGGTPTAGPNGGWSYAVVDGPKGGW